MTTGQQGARRRWGDFSPPSITARSCELWDLNNETLCDDLDFVVEQRENYSKKDWKEIVNEETERRDEEAKREHDEGKCGPDDWYIRAPYIR